MRKGVNEKRRKNVLNSYNSFLNIPLISCLYNKPDYIN